MSARRYPTAEVYEDRRDEFYRPNGRGGRETDIDIDIGIHEGRRPERRRQPDFLREDYGRTNAGPLVVRPREVEEFERPAPRPRRPEREVETDEVIVRRREAERPREREYERDDFMFRRDREPERRSPRGREVEETDIVLKREEGPRHRPRAREVEETDVIIRREESEHRRPKRRDREVEREEIIFRRREEERTRAPAEIDSEVIFKTRERGVPPPRAIAREREELVFRRRIPSPSPPPPPREAEKVIIRRRYSSPSPPPPPRQEKEEIIIRRRERSPSPQSPPEVEVVTRPTVKQEIVTHHHHHHYDHGVVRIRSPSPSPPRKPPAAKNESVEIEIKRRDGGRGFVEEDIVIERKERARSPEDREERRRRPREEIDVTVKDEVDFYDKRVAERAYIGEAYNGYTKDWAIVDVPPGTERVQMDGVGGASQEITWQRYNGVRRSKFVPERDAYALDIRRGDSRVGYPRPRVEEMWTEITKDLVIKEAIEELGYQYQETEFFFYVFEFLRYEDVSELVEYSDYIRRERRERIREIQWEKEEVEERRKGDYDEVIFEREIVYDRRGPRRRK